MRWTEGRLREHGLQPPRARVPRPTGPTSIADILARWVQETPDALASIGRFERLTYAELDRAVDGACAFLASRGVSVGDRVAATSGNHTDIVTAFLAVQRLGAIWVGINRNTAPGEKKYLLGDSGARLYLADATAAEQARGIQAALPELDDIIDMEPGNEDSAWRTGVRAHQGAPKPDVSIDAWAPAGIAYTSGTTGFPKGVVHSQHTMLLAAWVANVNSGELGPDTVRGTALPITIQNLMILGPVAAFSIGARHVCMDRIDAQGVADWIEAEGVTVTSLVPTVVQDLLTLPSIRPEALKSMRNLVTGAATVPQTLPALYQARFGKRLGVGYGITESPTGVASTHENSPSVQGAIGRPHFHLEVSIQDDEGRTVAAGEAGEICFRATQSGEWAGVYAGPLGYWRKGEATERLLRGGWVHTGDVGSFDADGELYIHDRRVDLIIRGGSNIYPAEVERVLRLDPRVRDAAVVGKSDQRLGEVVAAFIETFEPQDQGAFIAELTALCANEIAKYKIPVEWRIVDALPRNAMGKVMKPELRERLKKTTPA
jgi:acyl-CoA synthetase (AMP-forming)/AMP-acid ligase II